MSKQRGGTLTAVTAGGLVLVTMGLGSFLAVNHFINNDHSAQAVQNSSAPAILDSPRTATASSTTSSTGISPSTAAVPASTDATSPQADDGAATPPAAASSDEQSSTTTSPPASSASWTSESATPLPFPSSVNNACHRGDAATANATLPVSYVRIGNGSNVSDCDFVVAVADEVRSRSAANHALTSVTFSEYNAFRAGLIAKNGQVSTGTDATAKGLANKTNPAVEMSCTRHQGLTECDDTYGIGVKIWVQDDNL